MSDNWIKAFENTRLVKMGGMCFECCDYEDMVDDMKAFISQVEKDAIEKTKRETQKEIFDALDKLDMPKPLMALVKDSIGVIGPELKGLSPLLDAKSEPYTNGYRDGFDAGVEKTNKRWREKIMRFSMPSCPISSMEYPPGWWYSSFGMAIKEDFMRRISYLLEDKESV